MKEANRAIVVLSAFGLGGLFSFGSLLAARLERDGFTSASRDGMRAGYVALLALGLGASVIVPFILSAWAYPAFRRPLAIGFGVVSVVASLLFLVAVR